LRIKNLELKHFPKKNKEENGNKLYNDRFEIEHNAEKIIGH
jgi:hypothetical protein